MKTTSLNYLIGEFQVLRFLKTEEPNLCAMPITQIPYYLLASVVLVSSPLNIPRRNLDATSWTPSLVYKDFERGVGSRDTV